MVICEIGDVLRNFLEVNDILRHSHRSKNFLVVLDGVGQVKRSFAFREPKILSVGTLKKRACVVKIVSNNECSL